MLALYIHWPFCVSKCPYCDFNSHVRDSVDQVRWRNALLQELEQSLTPFEGRTLTSIFFGGGTPSLMPPETVEALIAKAQNLTRFSNDIEITLEANPTSVESEKFEAFCSAGVNRVSLGIQALDPDALKFLGRGHDLDQALSAIELSRIHFPRRSFDLIYGRAGQTASDWEEELSQAVALAADHLSLYQLTIEPGTHFFTLSKQGQTLTTDETLSSDLYDHTQNRLEALGLPAYEVSNHARAGAESRHNLAYWRYQDYVGIGPGAHGRETLNGLKTATQRERLPERWLAQVEAQGHALTERTPLSASAQWQEALLMGLRLSEPLTDQSLRARCGQGLDALDETKLQTLHDEGFLTYSMTSLQVLPEGRLRLNALLDYLLN